MKKSTFASYITTDFNGGDSHWLAYNHRVRILIGLGGMLLPVLLYSFLFLVNGITHPLESISHYYYTRVSAIFVAIMSMIGVFLIAYKGKAPIDFILSFIAGVAAFVVVFFPTGNISDICGDPTKPFSVTILPYSPFREMLHYFAAGVYIVCLALMSLFLFTRSNSPKSTFNRNKKIRIFIYKICGITMLLTVIVVFFGGYLDMIPEDIYTKNHITFWMESLAAESFGLSWLVKGEAMFHNSTMKHR